MADLVLTNGKIVTVDDRFTIARAVAVKGERIVAVGSAGEVAKFKGPATRTIDLRGRTVMPGLMTMVGGTIVHDALRARRARTER